MIPADFSIDAAAAVLVLFSCTFSELALTNPQTGKPFEWAQLEIEAVGSV